MPEEQHSQDTWKRLVLSAEERAALAEERRKAAEKRAEAAEKKIEQFQRHIWGAITDVFSVDELIARAIKKAEKG